METCAQGGGYRSLANCQHVVVNVVNVANPLVVNSLLWPGRRFDTRTWQATAG
jgi:hypothetical protein